MIRPQMRAAHAVLFAALLPTCGQIDIPVTLTLDPEAHNVLHLELPEALGGGVVTVELVGNIETVVSLDTDRLLTRRGVFATVLVEDLLIAGTPLELFGLDTGNLCVALAEDEPAGGVAFLRPLLRREAEFQLTIPTETTVSNPAVAALLPPLPLVLELDARTRMGLTDLLNLAFKGEGLRLREVVTTTVPEDYPILGGSVATLDVTLVSTRTPTADPMLDACEAVVGAQAPAAM
jgi:hypothetical protein